MHGDVTRRRFMLGLMGIIAATAPNAERWAGLVLRSVSFPAHGQIIQCGNGVVLSGEIIGCNDSDTFTVTDHHLAVVNDCFQIFRTPIPIPVLLGSEPPVPSIIRITKYKQGGILAIRIAVNSQVRRSVIVQDCDAQVPGNSENVSLMLTINGASYIASFILKRTATTVSHSAIAVAATPT